MKTLKTRFLIALVAYFAATCSIPLVTTQLPGVLIATVLLGLCFVLALCAWVLPAAGADTQVVDAAP